MDRNAWCLFEFRMKKCLLIKRQWILTWSPNSNCSIFVVKNINGRINKCLQSFRIKWFVHIRTFCGMQIANMKMLVIHREMCFMLCFCVCAIEKHSIAAQINISTKLFDVFNKKIRIAGCGHAFVTVSVHCTTHACAKQRRTETAVSSFSN